MKVKTVQIVWHGTENGKEPVYSLDFHPSGALMTAGGDKEIKVWKVEQGDDGYPTVDYTASLVGHSKTVNCVRFSPTGNYMVSGGDGVEMLLWKPSDCDVPRGLEGSGPAPWRRVAVMRGHNDDIMDVSWSCDGTALVSGSIDNKTIIWDMRKDKKRQGTMLHQLKEHRHYTQGVAWDPAQQFIVTQSADRTCIVHALRPSAAGKKNKAQQLLLPACDTAKEFHPQKFLKKRAMGTAAATAEPEKHPLFQDECIPTFFRRLAWSPDGSFLVIPSGQYKASPDSKVVNTAYIYARNRWTNPLMHLPGHPKPVVAVRFCPVIFQRGEPQREQGEERPEMASPPVGGAAAVDVALAGEAKDGPAPAAAETVMPFDLPYRMVFAVATLDSVVVYSTESLLPLAVIGQLHYDSITDLGWSSDGKYLAVSSRDCYCSIASFEPGELGVPLQPEELPPHIAARMAAAQHTAPPADAVAVPAKATKLSQPDATPLQKSSAAVCAAAPAVSPNTAETAAIVPQDDQQAGCIPVVAQQAEQQGGPGVGSAQPRQPVRERRRIQAEPVGPVPSQQQQQQQQEEVKRKRITPEAVGPAPAVVGDSQGGTQVFSAVAPLQPQQQDSRSKQPAGKKPRRIVPEQIQCGAAHSGAQVAGAFDQNPASNASAAEQPIGGPSAGVAATKPVKRITPILVSMPSAQQAALVCGRPVPTESGSMVGASAKQAKRITPTPINCIQAVSEHFENAKQVPYALPPSELSRDGCGGGQIIRRITPVPLSATSPLPEVADSRPHAAATAVAGRTSPAGGAGTSGFGGFNIAAMAMAAGQRAAMQGKGK